jgi:hypothetical protein
MPAIPIHNNSPLRPSHPTAVTPQTASNQNDTSSSSTRTVPATTTATISYSPPPPQPGARPIPLNATAPPPSPDPPPPQPGATPAVVATHISTTTTQLHPKVSPSQFSVPAPAQSYLPTKSTSLQPHTHTNPSPLLDSTAAQHSPAERGTAQSETHPHSLEHPPGYAQNPYAAGSVGHHLQNESFTGGEAQAGSDDGVWGDVKNWAGGVGEKLAAAESQAWKWAQGK